MTTFLERLDARREVLMAHVEAIEDAERIGFGGDEASASRSMQLDLLLNEMQSLRAMYRALNTLADMKREQARFERLSIRPVA